MMFRNTTLFEACYHGFSKLFTTEGRTSRTDFWLFFLVSFALCYAWPIVSAHMYRGYSLYDYLWLWPELLMGLGHYGGIALSLLTFSITFRRFRDMRLSPIVGVALLLVGFALLPTAGVFLCRGFDTSSCFLAPDQIVALLGLAIICVCGALIFLALASLPSRKAEDPQGGGA